MRIACVQFDAKIGQLDVNIARVESLLSGVGPVDLLVLPEMALIGYCFHDRAEIAPHTEIPDSGPSYRYFQKLAAERKCFVAGGFAERSTNGEFYNASMLVHPDGSLLHVHRKHFLYKTDETWATAGARFACRKIAGLGKCGFGICMDLNPKGFTNPFHWYEFASHLWSPPLKPGEMPRRRHHRLQAHLVILCNNWLRSADDATLSPRELSLRLINYWALRMKPVLGKPVIMVVANRVGVERDVHFAGTSCVVDLKTRSLLSYLDAESQGVLVVDDVPAYG